MASDVPHADGDSDVVVRVATWNVCLGADLEPLLAAGTRDSLVETTRTIMAAVDASRFPDRAERIAQVIADHRPDVLALQELGRWETGNGEDGKVLYSFPEIMLRALDSAGAPYVMVHCVDTFTGQLPTGDDEWVRFTSCDALLVRLATDVDLSVLDIDDGHYSAYLTAELAGGSRSFPIRRGWVSIDLERDDRRFRVLATHLDSLDADVRRSQMHELVALASTSRHPVVVIGDLNSVAIEAAGDSALSVRSDDGVLEVLGNAGYTDAWLWRDAVAQSQDPGADGGGSGRTWGPAPGLLAEEASVEMHAAERHEGHAGGREHGAAPTTVGRRDPSTRMTSRIDYVFFDPGPIAVRSAEVVGASAGDVTATEPHLVPSDHGCLLVTLAVRGSRPGIG